MLYFLMDIWNLAGYRSSLCAFDFSDARLLKLRDYC